MMTVRGKLRLRITVIGLTFNMLNFTFCRIKPVNYMFTADIYVSIIHWHT